MSSKSKEIKAVELISPWKFHRIFTVPATEKHGIMKVTYSIGGVDVDDRDEDVPTILFCGAMFGSRWQAAWINYLAEMERVRVVFIDRPGFGGSTPVDLHDRLPVVLEVIPLLLVHLKIKHVALACHSAGSIYAFNLLTQHPEILYSTHPSITFFSPWVHQSHSSVSFLTLASMLPNTALNYWNKIMSFSVNSAKPTFAASGGALTLVTSAFKNKDLTKKQKEEEERKYLAGYGLSMDMKDELDKAIFKYAFAENTEGANDDARLCLRSVSGVSWGACQDYEECIKNLAATWDEKVSEGGKPLKVNIHLPEEDMMVGDKGMKYFEECWREENRGEGMKVECARWKGTDHETAVNSSNEPIRRMFLVVKQLHIEDSRAD